MPMIQDKEELATVIRQMTWADLEDAAIEIIQHVLDMSDPENPSPEEIRLSAKRGHLVAAALSSWAETTAYFEEQEEG